MTFKIISILCLLALLIISVAVLDGNNENGEEFSNATTTIFLTMLTVPLIYILTH